ncbi:hypothetical protein G7Y89_g6493 [Cudoniella acicularis]|uniref:Uncharacterized protein n=1 Tax=Cudoniella acicularis TaxID=354080 RepID=A0A8H4W4Q0_9HELO|nr:hypothetical protein G7Y89_g6493 [Cudoniella acicularis]
MLLEPNSELSGYLNNASVCELLSFRVMMVQEKSFTVATRNKQADDDSLELEKEMMEILLTPPADEVYVEKDVMLTNLHKKMKEQMLKVATKEWTATCQRSASVDPRKQTPWRKSR